MAVRIKSVTITPKETTVGQSIFISINAEEPSWNDLKLEFQDWAQVKNNLTNWGAVKDYGSPVS